MLLRMTVQTLVQLAAIGLLLFVPAGRLDWPGAWAFLAIFVAGGVGIGLWLLRTDPDLLAARMRSPVSGDQAGRDKAVMWGLLAAFTAWFVFMGFDARFGWSAASPWLAGAAGVVGAAMILVAFRGWVAVLRENSFAAVTVRVHAERGQTVISTGPYARVRHPMYAYSLPFLLGTPLLLGSLWGVAWLVLFVPLLAARIRGEEGVLRRGLAGYPEYAARVRFRLVAGLW